VYGGGGVATYRNRRQASLCSRRCRCCDHGRSESAAGGRARSRLAAGFQPGCRVSLWKRPASPVRSKSRADRRSEGIFRRSPRDAWSRASARPGPASSDAARFCQKSGTLRTAKVVVNRPLKTRLNASLANGSNKAAACTSCAAGRRAAAIASIATVAPPAARSHQLRATPSVSDRRRACREDWLGCRRCAVS
jgi:hypothetical protein